MTPRPGCRIVVAPSFHLPIDRAERILLGPDGRAPDDREWDLLIADSALVRDLADCLCLFQLPRHLLASWGRLLEQAERTGAERLDGFDTFVADVADFLAFKDLPVPAGAVFELLVNAPGLCSIPQVGRQPGLWGGINLGDEAASLLLNNLTPDYPLVRLRIQPGEGFRLPAGGLLVDWSTLDKQEPDVLLLIRAG
jgi:hypothetical protein